ncbi:hypothetical protein QJS04_geneDACA012519 [Acorus gramineus]|uniref:Phytocyanin domain-containing protein n=1 Tax=Acorus gramineus TaxID=55184 RepID=A0AAV9BBV6_ACOGR|nr:hypothetical protein QJS04_geneDACA012519 [Acorus gramineus]
MALRVVAAVVAVLLAAAPMVFGANHVVGDSQQWNTGVDYTTWVSNQKFAVGDTLEFKYGPTHDVYEVSQSDHDSCSTNSPIKTHSGGDTSITLSSGSSYYLCSTSNHCSLGMKLAVTTAASSTPSGGGSGSSPPSNSPPSGSTTPSPPPPPPKGSGSGRVSSGVAVAGALALGLALMG